MDGRRVGEVRRADTGRSIKEVEMYLTGLSYREVLEHRYKDIGQGESWVSRGL